MSRADVLAHRVVAISRPPAPTERRITKAELAQHLAAHPAQVDRLVELGLPCIDLSVRRPGARPKRNLRFDLEEVERWLKGRS